MPCHPLACLSPFVTTPAGSAICIQLFRTGYEYSEQFFCIHSKQSRSWHLLKMIQWGNQLSESSLSKEVAHIAHPCLGSTQGSVSLREWLATGRLLTCFILVMKNCSCRPSLHLLLLLVPFKSALIGLSLWRLKPLHLQQLLRTGGYREMKWVFAAPWRNPTCPAASSLC